MEETDDPATRQCAVCNVSIHLCETGDQLQQALVNNWCVAMYEEDTDYPMLSGDVMPEYFTARFE